MSHKCSFIHIVENFGNVKTKSHIIGAPGVAIVCPHCQASENYPCPERNTANCWRCLQELKGPIPNPGITIQAAALKLYCNEATWEAEHYNLQCACGHESALLDTVKASILLVSKDFLGFQRMSVGYGAQEIIAARLRRLYANRTPF